MPGQEEVFAIPVDSTEIFKALESDYTGAPVSRSGELWNLRRTVSISAHNRSLGTIIEKAVANLGERRHMPGYYNQCPTVSGIFGSHAGRRSSVEISFTGPNASGGRALSN